MMGNRLKYVALSAFVLPGLGQLARGERIKGGVMIMLDNVFILGALFIALRSASKLMAAKVTGISAEAVVAGIRTDAPFARWVLAAFMVLWIYGIVDAAVGKGSSSIN
jgi:hypothetical protein